ncbi:MAG: IS110 family transposase [Deltaproteobacteria bacterium]|nr:IS110 family transposase [Deltaproteobacteria bacterium]
MTELQPKVTERVLVAVDVAKYEHVVFVSDPSGATESFRIKNRRADFDQLREKLVATGLPVQIGLEPTCSFHRNICYYFLSHGFEVRGISTLVLARTREALHNSWDKNDFKDADVILYLMRQGMTQTLSEPFYIGYNHLQELSKTYEQIVHRKTKIQHSIINHYLPIYFPEAHVFFRGSRTLWFNRMLKHFPVPSLVIQYTFDEFLQIASPILGKVPYKHSLVQDFYSLAKESIGIPVDKDSYEVKMFRYSVEEHERLNQQLFDLQEEIEQLLSDNKDYQIMKSVPGIGPLIALTILAEAGDLRRFRYERQFLKYCGLNLSTEQSGVSRGFSRISKRGNPRLRRVFWQAARGAIYTCKENNFTHKYERYVRTNPDNSNLKRKARVATAAKVARVVFGLIKKNERYRSQIDGTNPGGRTRGNLDVEAALV